MVCLRRVPGVTGTLGKANSHFNPTQTGRGPHHHIEVAVDWYSSNLLALLLHTTYTTEISHFIIQKDYSQYVRWLHGVVVRASASQSVDQWFIPLVESNQKTLKNGIHSFPAWRSAFMGGCGEQAGKFACCVLGQGT